MVSHPSGPRHAGPGCRACRRLLGLGSGATVREAFLQVPGRRAIRRTRKTCSARRFDPGTGPRVGRAGRGRGSHRGVMRKARRPSRPGCRFDWNPEVGMGGGRSIPAFFDLEFGGMMSKYSKYHTHWETHQMVRLCQRHSSEEKCRPPSKGCRSVSIRKQTCIWAFHYW